MFKQFPNCSSNVSNWTIRLLFLKVDRQWHTILEIHSLISFRILQFAYPDSLFVSSAVDFAVPFESSPVHLSVPIKRV
jgi:hypothetical protein